MRPNFRQILLVAQLVKRAAPTREQFEAARRAGEEMGKAAGRIGFEAVRAMGLFAAVAHNMS